MSIVSRHGHNTFISYTGKALGPSVDCSPYQHNVIYYIICKFTILIHLSVSPLSM